MGSELDAPTSAPRSRLGEVKIDRNAGCSGFQHSPKLPGARLVVGMNKKSTDRGVRAG